MGPRMRTVYFSIILLILIMLTLLVVIDNKNSIRQDLENAATKRVVNENVTSELVPEELFLPISVVNEKFTSELVPEEIFLPRSLVTESVAVEQVSEELLSPKALCPELFSTSLDIECFYEGNQTSCDDPMLHGTIAKLKCKHSYYLENIPFNELHCRNGIWNQPLYNCEPVCGKKTFKSIPLVVRGKTADRGDFPWHIGLYLRKKSDKKYICGGSILSPKLVITAAHCITRVDAKLYQVAAGKIHREWIHENDDKAQYRDVVNICIADKYTGLSTGHTADMAILVLNQVFILSDLILPVCLDYMSTSLDTTVGIIPGWGLTSEDGYVSDYLQYTSLPLRDHDDCLMTVPADFAPQVSLDKICAGYTNGTSVCTGDSGGGLVSPKEINGTDTRYFLIGLVSTGPFKKGTCNSYQYTTFTNIASHIKWINETKFKYEIWTPYDYGCILPDLPLFGNYTVDVDVPNKEILIPGSLVPHYTKLNYSCNAGYRIHGKGILTCKEKIWNVNNYIPACFQTCPRLNSTDVDLDYLFNNVIKPTDNSILHETRALFRCKNFNYELETSASKQTTCRDGQWTKPLPNCIPICGVNTIGNKPHLNYLSVVIEKEAPWNVAIFKQVADDFQLECAGTILSSFLVITESKCVNQIEIDKYIVIAGSIQKLMKSTTDKNIQKSVIHRKITNENFNIIVLKERLNITAFVRPICLYSIETVLEINKMVTLETSFWTKENENLKIIKFETEISSLENPINYINISDNLTAVIAGGISTLTQQNLKTRYCIVGIGLNTGTNTSFYLFQKTDIIFLKLVLDRNNIQSFHMSECVVPTAPKHARTVQYNYKEGDTVVDGSILKYTCEKYYNLYGSDEITCKNGSWIYPLGNPYCIGCGISHLKLFEFGPNITEIHFSTNVSNFPWQAYIYDTKQDPTTFNCTGVIISSKIILTGDFCAQGLKDTVFHDDLRYYVEVGRYNWDTSLDVYYQKVGVKEIIYAGLYIRISAFILNEDLQINENVLPVCLDFEGIMNPYAPLLLPYGKFKKKNASTTNVLYISNQKRFHKIHENLFVYKMKEPCLYDNLWTESKGNALIFPIYITKNEYRYFLRSFVVETECIHDTINFVRIDRYFKWLKYIVNKY